MVSVSARSELDNALWQSGMHFSLSAFCVLSTSDHVSCDQDIGELIRLCNYL